jgi:hypothetical protein
VMTTCSNEIKRDSLWIFMNGINRNIKAKSTSPVLPVELVPGRSIILQQETRKTRKHFFHAYYTGACITITVKSILSFCCTNIQYCNSNSCCYRGANATSQCRRHEECIGSRGRCIARPTPQASADATKNVPTVEDVALHEGERPTHDTTAPLAPPPAPTKVRLPYLKKLRSKRRQILLQHSSNVRGNGSHNHAIGSGNGDSTEGATNGNTNKAKRSSVARYYCVDTVPSTPYLAQTKGGTGDAAVGMPIREYESFKSSGSDSFGTKQENKKKDDDRTRTQPLPSHVGKDPSKSSASSQ